MGDAHEVSVSWDAIRMQMEVMNALVTGAPVVEILEILLKAIHVRFAEAGLAIWTLHGYPRSFEPVWRMGAQLGLSNALTAVDDIAVNPDFEQSHYPTELADALGRSDGLRWFAVKNTKTRLVGWLVVESVSPWSDAQTFIIEQYIRMAGLIIEKAQLDEENYFLAYHDYLTEVPNRRLFHQRLEQYLQEAQDSFDPVSLVLLDVDRFKAINDTYGHRAGDEVLRAVARRLIAGIQPKDTVARMGGDEFGLIFPGLDGPHAVDQVKALMTRLADPLTEIHALTVQTSAGVATCPHHATTVDALLHCADTALYEAKQMPTYGVVLYSPSPSLGLTD